MKNIKKYKNQIILGVIVLLVLVGALLIFFKLDTDGMNNNGIYYVKYKVYQNGSWSRNSKNGITVGDKENPIQNISISANKRNGRIYYYTYTNDWSDQTYDVAKENSNQLYGLKINTSNLLHKKYMICYRTYNKKDKWLNWSCDGEINGNKEEPITALEMKIIPKNGIKFDYLKGYNKKIEKNINF